jgi:hypothetical protein
MDPAVAWSKILLGVENVRWRRGGVSMIDNCGLVSIDRPDAGRYTSLQRLERALNQAIVQAEISESYEEYLEILDEFYADDIEVSSENGEEPIRGKARVRSLIATFLVPLHIMAEIGGLLISLRQTPIPGDGAPDETHSSWTLELVGVSGRSCTVSWRSLRKWNGSRVVYEYHYDHQQSGGPLTSVDLSFNAVTSAAGFRRPS